MLPLFKVRMNPRAVELATEVLQSGYIGQGPKVDEFESELDEMGYEGAITVNSATSGLHLALHCIKQESHPDQDEVLTHPITCSATIWPILANGFKIRWVDTDDQALGIDPDDMESKLSPRTAAVLMTHWGGCDGFAADVHEMLADCPYRPAIIEDCAHSFGAAENGRLGRNNWKVFSFQAIKHLTTGDGGMILAPRRWRDRVRLLRWYGLDRTESIAFRCVQDVEHWGFKFHMNDINAAIGIGNITGLDKAIKMHQGNSRNYHEQLEGVSGVKLLVDDPSSSCWLFTILVDDRSGLSKKLAENGIETSPVHRRNDTHPCVKQFREGLHETNRIAREMLCLPVGWWVTEEDVDRVCSLIREGW